MSAPTAAQIWQQLQGAIVAWRRHEARDELAPEMVALLDLASEGHALFMLHDEHGALAKALRAVRRAARDADVKANRPALRRRARLLKCVATIRLDPHACQHAALTAKESQRSAAALIAHELTLLTDEVKPADGKRLFYDAAEKIAGALERETDTPHVVKLGLMALGVSETRAVTIAGLRVKK